MPIALNMFLNYTLFLFFSNIKKKKNNYFTRQSRAQKQSLISFLNKPSVQTSLDLYDYPLNSKGYFLYIEFHRIPYLI